MTGRDLDRAARCGEPSHVWRAGQERRLGMILEAAAGREAGCVLDDGCGVGAYLERLAPLAASAYGVEYDAERARQAALRARGIVRATAERLPFAGGLFDLILSHEVLEHVADDRAALEGIVRLLRPGGRLALFVPNRGYPFETHGVFWRGRYRFGNIPLINYLPSPLRRRLAPHVRAYTTGELRHLLAGLPVHIVRRETVFGAYDNIIARWPRAGRLLRAFLQSLERTPLRLFGLSHFWVVEKSAGVGTCVSTSASTTAAHPTRPTARDAARGDKAST